MERREASRVITRLFDEWYASLVRYGRHGCGSSALAEEFAQEAYLALYKNLREGVEIACPRAWLVATVRNQLRNHWRSQRGEVLLPNSEFEFLACFEEKPDANLEADGLALADYLSLLSEREEEAILLRAEGYRYRQIAERMGLTTGSVGVLILRASRKMRRAKDEETPSIRPVEVNGRA